MQNMFAIYLAKPNTVTVEIEGTLLVDRSYRYRLGAF